MKKIKEIKAKDGTIKSIILKDAEGEISYIKDVAEYGCIGGNCNNLFYYEETHNFYNDHAEEIDELIERLNDEMDYDIAENMKRLGQTDLRNFLAWLAYEVNAQEIIKELEE
jgi:hypothetical protein